jgi:protein TonB
MAMFDLIVSGHRNTTRRDLAPLAISWGLHALAMGAVILLPLLFATSQLPAVPKEILTYVTVAAPPPPPPPPPAPAIKPAAPRPAPKPRLAPKLRPVPQAPVLEARELQVPIEANEEGSEFAGNVDSFEGVPGGMLGGVPGGVLGGVVGGIPDVPPPPPPPAPRAPVRTGGQIKAPALIKRVAPVYPPLAVNAQVEGVVILEATVGRDGRVEDVKVLRSIGLLERAAIDAVREWQYEPLLLNGQPERFILTVTVSFSLS